MGEAGVGKTRPARKLSRRSSDLGATVMWGSCPQVELKARCTTADFWRRQRAQGSSAPKTFIGHFNWEVNNQSGKAIKAAEAAPLLSWGNDLYSRN